MLSRSILLSSLLFANGPQDTLKTFLLEPPNEVRLLGEDPTHGKERDREGSVSTLFNQEAPQRLDTAADQMLVKSCRTALAASLLMPETAERKLELSLIAVDRDARAGQATAFFVQTAGGVRIEGTQLTCSVHGNRVAFLRHVLVLPPSLMTLPRVSAPEALGKMLRAHPGSRLAAAEDNVARPERVIVYVARGPKSTRMPTLSWRAEVSFEEAHERLSVFLDATTGTELGTFSLSQALFQGQLTMPIEVSCHGEAQVTVPLPYARFEANSFADGDGLFDTNHEMFFADISLISPFVRMIDHDVAVPESYHLPLKSFGFNELFLEEAPLSVTTPYYHVHHARNWARNLASPQGSQQRFLDTRLDVHVNLRGDSCDAYYNGSLNFLAAGQGCLNTGRSAGIVYHEYAHALHAHSVPPGMPTGYDGQVSEGVGDYVAATLTESPYMRGLTSCTDTFRSCSNRLSWCESGGCDFDSSSEDHAAGQVLCGAFWDLRTLLRSELGPRRGAETADRIHLRFLALVGGMASVYQAVIAADDDDDADPTNGTTHSCEINRAFAGVGSITPAHFPHVEHLVPCRRRPR